MKHVDCLFSIKRGLHICFQRNALVVQCATYQLSELISVDLVRSNGYDSLFDVVLFQNNIEIVNEWIPNDISSTKVR